MDGDDETLQALRAYALTLKRRRETELACAMHREKRVKISSVAKRGGSALSVRNLKPAAEVAVHVP